MTWIWRAAPLTVKENDTLDLGRHTLHFYLTPMVHWPEVMMTFEEQKVILFSADAFGSFGALNGNIFNDELDFDRRLGFRTPAAITATSWANTVPRYRRR